jgi:hypothetical protein
MNYNKFKYLLPNDRVKAYREEIEHIENTLFIYGLDLDSPCRICDDVLSHKSLGYLIPKPNNYKGVYKRSNGTYYSKITKKGKYIFLGNFIDAYEAALIYDDKCYELYHNLNKLNFPELIGENTNATHR